MNCFDVNYLDGAKYFINYVSLYKDLQYLPYDIRTVIWKHVIEKQYMKCRVCNAVLLELLINNTNNNLILIKKNYTIKSGYGTCNGCEKYKQD